MNFPYHAIRRQNWYRSLISTFMIVPLAWSGFSPSLLNAATFYVSPTGSDSNPGTELSPWKSIGKAASTLSAGDTAIVVNGIYTEPQIQFTKSGTASQPIVIRAQNKHQAILSSTSGCNPNISIYGSYVTIEDLRSSISPSNVACSAHNSADGTGVRCWHTNPATTSNPSTGSTNCVVRGMLFDSSPARSHAVKTSQDYSLVENCTANSGIEAFNNYGSVFRNNVIVGGDAWDNSLVAKGGVRNFEAYNNVIRIRSTWGIGLVVGGLTGTQWLFDPASGVEAYNSVAYNNVVIDESGGNAQSLGMMGAKDSAIFNNIVQGNYLFLQPGNTGVASTNPTIKNNIVSCIAGPSLGKWSYDGTLNLDFNNFYNCSAPPAQAHPILGNPLFVAAGSDWHLTANSPAIGRGVAITAVGFKGETLLVNKDRDGKVRTAPWDLGIYAMSDAAADTTPPAPPIIVGIR